MKLTETIFRENGPHDPSLILCKGKEFWPRSRGRLQSLILRMMSGTERLHCDQTQGQLRPSVQHGAAVRHS
jgi:hypothetical protein